MATDSRFKMSQERYDALKEELQYLETDKAKEVSEQIKEARSFGDLSENSEYDEAKTEQGKLYSKIAEIKVLLENAEIVERSIQAQPRALLLSAALSRSVTLTMTMKKHTPLSARRKQTPWMVKYLTTPPSAGACTAMSQAIRSMSMPPQESCILRFFP